MPVGQGPNQSKQTKTRSSRSTKAQDAIKLLKADHDEVEELFAQYERQKKKNGAKADLIEKICSALTVHAQVEEEIFYPAVREAFQDDEDVELIDEAEVEHATLKSLVEQLETMSPDDELYDAKVKVLSEYVKHHVKEEEGEIFPKVKKSDLDLEELGTELSERKSELMAEK
jgi:hemerythrin superfamily protein